MALPPSCADCTFFQREGTVCRRHAPGTGFEEMEITCWPKVREADRCGSGEKVGDGGEATVACGRCIHWLQPRGEGINPDYRQGLSREWWAESGYCTRFAPSPSGEEDRQTWWRVTNSGDRCGDGEEVKWNED